MEPILSKQEIADLLVAIKQGHASTVPVEKDVQQQQITYSDLDLFQVTSKRNDTIKIPNFDIILDSFSHNYSISLSNQLQRTFAITRSAIDSMPFHEYLLAKTNPGSIGVLDLAPLKHGALVLYDPQLSFSIIEIMLGASTDLDLLQMERKLTKIELTVLKSVIDKACGDLDRAFMPVSTLESSLLKIENNPRLVAITDPESEVVIGSFQVTVGDMAGSIDLVFPLATLEPLREEFKDLLNVHSLKQGSWTNIIIDQLKEMTATVIAQSGVVTVSVGQVLDFTEGDIITLDYDLNSSLRILVEEKLKFFAIPGIHKGKKAISLSSVYE